jgi:hypothetical protein
LKVLCRGIERGRSGFPGGGRRRGDSPAPPGSAGDDGGRKGIGRGGAMRECGVDGRGLGEEDYGLKFEGGFA